MPRKPARPSFLFDQYRAEALQGIRHQDLSDADREWIWRSLLKGVRRKKAVLLSGLPPDQVEHALEWVKRWYRQRAVIYKRQQAAKVKPKVVKPVASPPVRQRRWPFSAKE